MKQSSLFSVIFCMILATVTFSSLAGDLSNKRLSPIQRAMLPIPHSWSSSDELNLGAGYSTPSPQTSPRVACLRSFAPDATPSTPLASIILTSSLSTTHTPNTPLPVTVSRPQ